MPHLVTIAHISQLHFNDFEATTLVTSIIPHLYHSSNIPLSFLFCLDVLQALKAKAEAEAKAKAKAEAGETGGASRAGTASDVTLPSGTTVPKVSEVRNFRCFV